MLFVGRFYFCTRWTWAALWCVVVVWPWWSVRGSGSVKGTPPLSLQARGPAAIWNFQLRPVFGITALPQASAASNPPKKNRG